MAFTYYGFNTLKVFNTDGSICFEMKTPTCAFDVAYIDEDNSLAITSGGSTKGCITIIDIRNKQIKTVIQLYSQYSGISVNDAQFICSGAEIGIQLINPSNFSREDITQDEIPHECNIAHFN